MRLAHAGSDFVPRKVRPMKKKPDGLTTSESLVSIKDEEIDEENLVSSVNESKGFINLDESEIYAAQSLGRD